MFSHLNVIIDIRNTKKTIIEEAKVVLAILIKLSFNNS